MCGACLGSRIVLRCWVVINRIVVVPFLVNVHNWVESIMLKWLCFCSNLIWFIWFLLFFVLSDTMFWLPLQGE